MVSMYFLFLLGVKIRSKGQKKKKKDLKGLKGRSRDLDETVGEFPSSFLECVMERAWNA